MSSASRTSVLARSAALLVLTGICVGGWQQWARAQDIATPAETVPAAIVDPSRIEGHAKCVDCHAQEIKAWQASKHATRAFDLLRTAPTSLEYAKKLGIRPTDIARNSLCTTCHATQQRDEVGRLRILGGVSCEACHNASGGDDGWLNAHAVYGPRGTRREAESAEHYAQRTATCETAGQFRSANAYQLVKRCFDCHVVRNEALAEAGHDHGDGFEFVTKALGEVRHNFFLDRHGNAEVATLWTDPLHHEAGRNAAGRKRVLFVLGQLIDLETSLRSLATATDESDFSDLMVERIEDAWGLLAEDLLEELEETKIAEVTEATEAVETVVEKLDDDGFDPNDQKLYLEAAATVGKAARQFAARNGNQLEEVDDLDLIPEGPFEGAYQP
ncbi:MAG: cytochrome c family protein [Planctomycetes bacterium]|nr:cytochrome c family protein [Planctomycetota bacterium]